MSTESENKMQTIADDLVVTKYKMAADIVNRVLKTIIEESVVGASVRALCTKADNMIIEETGKAFKKDRKMPRGVAFPCCLSVNNCICHFTPLASDPDLILQKDDVVKIDLGAHIDGFIAVVAHTVVVGVQKVTGRRADVILAAHYASEAALRLVRPGGETYAVTDIVDKIAEAYDCKPIEGMLSHQLEQHRIDGSKTVIQNPSEAQRKEHDKFDFGLHEVYGIDVLISTGEGQGREKLTKVSVFKRTDETYMLKMKNSREFLSQANKKHGNLPFTLSSFENETKARMGVVECVAHNLVEPFQVLYEKERELVAQFKYTVLLMPNGPDKITGLPFDPSMYDSYKSIKDPEILKILKTSANSKSSKKKKKAAAEKAISEENPPKLVDQ